MSCLTTAVVSLMAMTKKFSQVQSYGDSLNNHLTMNFPVLIVFLSQGLPVMIKGQDCESMTLTLIKPSQA